MKRYKPRMARRKGQAPAITVPRTMTQVTYFNIPLVKYLERRDIDRMKFIIDTDEHTINVRKARDNEKGYKVLATGLRGHGVSPKFRKYLPAGRYELVDRRSMKFERV